MTDLSPIAKAMEGKNRVQGMVRSIDQYRNCDPKAIADGSYAQILYALTDDKHDILVLWNFAVATGSENIALALQLEAMKREMAEKDERIAALEAGIKPFAAHQTADGLSGPGSLLHIPDDHPLLFNGLGNDLCVTVTVGDVRRARALLGGENAGN